MNIACGHKKSFFPIDLKQPPILQLSDSIWIFHKAFMCLMQMTIFYLQMMWRYMTLIWPEAGQKALEHQ